ncbi:uncharacterized protein VTP21DRAFT_5532 [Calcarisporiella thermophila]|uniref:uncharacterized protein n=1 Tax=Calcarisporiella thermophila TaxID=911321 RepID=UPI003741FBC0
MDHIKSAWPSPPDYYKRYTNDAILLLRSSSPSASRSSPTSESSAKASAIDLDSLRPPPPPPPTGSYQLFGATWPVEDKILGLKDMNVKQLYPDGAIDRVKELKKLNHSLLLCFLELVDILIMSPSQHKEKIDNMNLILINMYHLLNEYRPHQARETLRMMLEDQVEKKRKATEEVNRLCDDIETTLAKITSSLRGDDGESSVEEKTPAEDAMVVEAMVTEDEGKKRLLELVDQIT